MSKTLVVMQPTVLPWSGYFNLMHLSDDFVFHDDIQLEKRSWQTRNRLLLDGKVDWISLPIEHLGEKQKISDTRVLVDRKWTDKVDRAFRRSYEKHPHFNAAAEVMACFLSFENDNLALRNEAVIRLVAERLGIQTRIHRASELGIEGVRSERLMAFCKFFQADTYLSPLGSKEYLMEDQFEARSPSQLVFQDYPVLPYPQTHVAEFVPSLSIVDVVANLGWAQAKAYIIGSHQD
jgi:hypothetical protein